MLAVLYMSDFVKALPENHHFPKPAYSHSVLATFHGLCAVPNLEWHTSSPPTLLPIHHHLVVSPALITIDIYIYTRNHWLPFKANISRNGKYRYDKFP